MAPVLAIGLVLAACGVPGAADGAKRPQLDVSIEPNSRTGQLPIPPGRHPTLGPLALNPSKANGIQLNVLSALLDDTPVFNGDFADPFALRTPDALYLYSSNTVATHYAPAAHIPVIELTESSAFEGHYLGDALPKLPKWTVSGFQWAPSVWARPDGTYVMYYSTPATIPILCRSRSSSPGCIRTTKGVSSAMCISAATSRNPSGPFVDDSSSAFVCPVSQGGAIDPSVFIASNGTPWLLWKSDGDCCGLATTIYSQQLAPDGLSIVGPAYPLMGATQPWEGGLVEAPSMVQSGSNLWLFYSANLWGTEDYGIGVAECASVSGPCTKPLDHAWLASNGNGGERDRGPGGQEFFQAGGLIWMVFHGLAPGQSGNTAQRRLYVHLLTFPSGQPPKIADGDPAAALAEAVLYDDDPNLPAEPRSAYLELLHKVPGAYSDDSDTSLLADGMLSCSDLGRDQSASQTLASLERRHLSAFESYLVAMLSTKYFCPEHVFQALVDVQQALANGP